MKIAFKIPPVSNKSTDTHLLVEAGKEDISFLLFSKNSFKIEGLFSYQFEKNLPPSVYMEDIKSTIKEFAALHPSNISSCNVFYNFPTSTLVPLQYFVEDEKEKMIELMFGYGGPYVSFQENVKGHNIKNVYSLPAPFYSLFADLYPNNKFAHSTSYQISNNTGSENLLQCIVYSGSIKVLLFKNGQLQITQYFDYVTPLDVCYHLLNVAERFQIPVSSVSLQLSGMIDAGSKLYDELYKYFLHISFGVSPGVNVAEDMNGLQPHFYHHLTALALCV